MAASGAEPSPCAVGGRQAGYGRALHTHASHSCSPHSHARSHAGMESTTQPGEPPGRVSAFPFAVVSCVPPSPGAAGEDGSAVPGTAAARLREGSGVRGDPPRHQPGESPPGPGLGARCETPAPPRSAQPPPGPTGRSRRRRRDSPGAAAGPRRPRSRARPRPAWPRPSAQPTGPAAPGAPAGGVGVAPVTVDPEQRVWCCTAGTAPCTWHSPCTRISHTLHHGHCTLPASRTLHTHTAHPLHTHIAHPPAHCTPPAHHTPAPAHCSSCRSSAAAPRQPQSPSSQPWRFS